jgi:hypothetical protein
MIAYLNKTACQVSERSLLSSGVLEPDPGIKIWNMGPVSTLGVATFAHFNAV